MMKRIIHFIIILNFFIPGYTVAQDINLDEKIPKRNLLVQEAREHLSSNSFGTYLLSTYGLYKVMLVQHEPTLVSKISDREFAELISLHNTESKMTFRSLLSLGRAFNLGLKLGVSSDAREVCGKLQHLALDKNFGNYSDAFLTFNEGLELRVSNSKDLKLLETEIASKGNDRGGGPWTPRYSFPDVSVQICARGKVHSLQSVEIISHQVTAKK